MVTDLTIVKRETSFINLPCIWDLLRIDCGITATDTRSAEEIKEEALNNFEVNAAHYLEQVLQKPVVIVDGDEGILDEMEKGSEFYIIHETQVKEIKDEFEKYLNE